MFKRIISLSLAILLTGCSYLHIQKLVVEQGNVITPDQISQLHKGMSENEVRDLMGNPVTLNIFTPNRIEYVYTYQKSDLARTVNRVSLVFQNGALVSIQRTGI